MLHNPTLREKVELQLKDKDLGKTILLWTADLIQEYLNRENPRKIIITDAPNRNPKSPALQIERNEEGNFKFLCSSTAYTFQRNPFVELIHKVRIRMGQHCEIASLDSFQVVKRQQHIRELVSNVLGVKGVREPRFLLRVDDFPSFYESSEKFQDFHDILSEYRLPYLLAVTPFLARENGPHALTDPEVTILQKCQEKGMTVALHGFTHRSEYGHIASELEGMPAEKLTANVKKASEDFAAKGMKALGFVPPFNSYDASTTHLLAQEFSILAGGPESVNSIGYRGGPSFFMNSLYVPCYRPAYDVNEKRLAELEQLIALAGGCVIPITLHWHNEVRDGFRSLRKLAQRLQGKTISWNAFKEQSDALI